VRPPQPAPHRERSAIVVAREAADPRRMIPRALPNRREAYANCSLAAAAFLACTGLLCAAVAARAPLAVLPLLAAVCIGCPMALGWSLPGSIALLRAAAQLDDADSRALKALRGHLDQLPETPHPLGF
jgi:hypothetical protein